MFSLRSFRSYIHILNSFWVNFYAKLDTYLCSCANDCPVFPKLFVEDNVFYPLFIHAALFTHKLIMFAWFISLFCSIALCLFLCQCHTLLITLDVVLNLEIHCLLFSSSFSRLLWLFRAFCGSVQILVYIFLVCGREKLKFYRDYVESLLLWII